MKKPAHLAPPLRRRFLLALIAYTGVILALWYGYHNIGYDALSRSAKENTLLATDNLIELIGTEFTQMRTAAAVIAGSPYVRDFMKERIAAAYYEKAEIAAEIARNAVFPIASADSVITLHADGTYYRFMGGISGAACEELYDTFRDAGAVFTVVQLDGAFFFCHSAPIFDHTGASPARLGNIVILTGLDRANRLLDREGRMANIDIAVILDGIVILSDNPALADHTASSIARQYDVVSTAPVEGTALSVAAALPRGAVFPEGAFFWVLAFALLCLLLGMVAVLYRYLSLDMIRPMADIIAHVREIGGGRQGRLPKTGKQDFDALVVDINDMIDRTERYNAELIAERQKLFDNETARQKMRVGLLATQIDAHFVVNSLMGIRHLSQIGDGEKAAQMAEGLAALLQHRHVGDALVNVFEDFEMLERYAALMNLRYNDRFRVDFDVDDTLVTYTMPGLILQPLVENALTHGLQGKESDARLRVVGTARGDELWFEISDNGAGIPPAKLQALQESLAQTDLGDFPEPGLRGVALTNIQRRIRLRFGTEYGIAIQSAWGQGTTVTVRLPLLPEEGTTRTIHTVVPL